MAASNRYAHALLLILISTLKESHGKARFIGSLEAIEHDPKCTIKVSF